MIEERPALSLVIPVYNEEENIDELCQRCTAALSGFLNSYEIIVVSDGSTDRSVEKLLKWREANNSIRIIELSRNFGHQQAILAGLELATGNYVAIIDGDLQDPPEILSQFYEKAKEGFDVVYAVRKKRKEGRIKRALYFAFYRILNGVTEIPIPPDSGDFGLFSARVRTEMVQSTEHSLFLRGIRSWVGFRQVGLEYERSKRSAGDVKYSFSKLVRLAYNGIFSFSEFPVRVLTKIGLLLLVISLGYSIYAFIRYFNGNAPTGFTTLVLAIFFFGSVQIFTLGIVGEYVLRTYNESRKRPLYIVKEKYI